MTAAPTIIFQAAKLGDLSPILAEFERAERLLREGTEIGRIYGVSGGALVALGFGLALAAQRNPQRWGRAHTALVDLAQYLRRARSREIRRLNGNPLYGFFNLGPLRRRVAALLRRYAGRDDGTLSELSVPLYLCAVDGEGLFTLLGPADEALQCLYGFTHVGPPRDAPILDATLAALSTMLSTEPVLVSAGAGQPAQWLRDCRPAIVDAAAIVADLEAADPRPILRTPPYAPIRSWKLNWFTSSFIMHSQNERNQTLLAAHYLDLLERQRALEGAYRRLAERVGQEVPCPRGPLAGHVYLPYVGSTEALTNMRQSVRTRTALVARFRELLQGQLDNFAFDRPANVIYGAGGFSGILAGTVATRAVDLGFERNGGQIRQIYGVSAGVLNGFFHAVHLAAARHPDLYTPAARNALDDLEEFLAHIEPKRVVRLNLNPCRLWRGFANLGPLEQYLLDRLAAYTGSRHPAEITFDDIALPLTVVAARRDGFSEFLGMTDLGRRMCFGGIEWQVRPAPVIRAIIAGWSMNTYIVPTELDGQVYQDGGGTFYDPALFVACLDPELTSLLNIDLAEPEDHSYHLPPRPNIVRIAFDTHNYTFTEERRRMRSLVDLLYQHYRLRARHAALLGHARPEIAAAHALPADFRRAWIIGAPKELP